MGLLPDPLVFAVQLRTLVKRAALWPDFLRDQARRRREWPQRHWETGLGAVSAWLRLFPSQNTHSQCHTWCYGCWVSVTGLAMFPLYPAPPSPRRQSMRREGCSWGVLGKDSKCTGLPHPTKPGRVGLESWVRELHDFPTACHPCCHLNLAKPSSPEQHKAVDNALYPIPPWNTLTRCTGLGSCEGRGQMHRPYQARRGELAEWIRCLLGACCSEAQLPLNPVTQKWYHFWVSSGPNHSRSLLEPTEAARVCPWHFQVGLGTTYLEVTAHQQGVATRGKYLVVLYAPSGIWCKYFDTDDFVSHVMRCSSHSKLRGLRGSSRGLKGGRMLTLLTLENREKQTNTSFEGD